MKGRVLNRFDEGIAKRSAIYVPFPQAVPLKYTVDPTACLYLSRGTCGKTFLCKDACAAGAIDFEQQEEIVDLEVGAIIVATGFDLLDARLKPEFGYGVYPEVMTGIEFERLSSASGPTMGKIAVNGKEPKDVVFIKCVGSRERRREQAAPGGVPYCSRVCCMYTAKHAHLVRDKLPDARITVFYMDVRAFGKGYEEFYDRVKHERVMYRRGEPSEVYRRGGTGQSRLVVLAEDTMLGKPVEVEADLVVLANAVVPRTDMADVAGLLGLERSPDGFFQEAHPKLRPVDTSVDGVFLAGCCQGPKDIPDTVAHGKAAAASALGVLVRHSSSTHSSSTHSPGGRPT
jgi:heterodisulfide reductase subunit A